MLSWFIQIITKETSGRHIQPQLLNLSLVCSLFLAIIQAMNACFGMLPLNQTEACHGTDGPNGFRASQVEAAEKDGFGMAGPNFHKKQSSASKSMISCAWGREFLINPMVGLLLRERETHQSPFWIASETEAWIGSPDMSFGFQFLYFRFVKFRSNYYIVTNFK